MVPGDNRLVSHAGALDPVSVIGEYLVGVDLGHRNEILDAVYHHASSSVVRDVVFDDRGVRGYDLYPRLVQGNNIFTDCGLVRRANLDADAVIVLDVAVLDRGRCGVSEDLDSIEMVGPDVGFVDLDDVAGLRVEDHSPRQEPADDSILHHHVGVSQDHSDGVEVGAPPKIAGIYTDRGSLVDEHRGGNQLAFPR